MTSLLQPNIVETYATITKDTNHNIRYSYCRHGLKSKQNTYKHKCRKLLKRKLKQYKLRQDGKEDQDIIDVSDTLVSSLLIRSPNKTKDSAELALEELRPKNYLFRMVRRKQTTLSTPKSVKPSENNKKSHIKDEPIQISPTTEEKKQTNAFKLLMDSRNKSIGSNSPGKEKPINHAETEDLIEKKSIKAKRNIMLQKMAEEKGLLKNKEMEEEHENFLKIQMDKRAEKLKKMIMNKEPKTLKNDKQNGDINSQTHSPLDSIHTAKNKNTIDTPKQKLQLVSIFQDSIDKNHTPPKKIIPKEDEDFLKKLSPSLRKKESMLCYFKKVDKDSDITQPDSENDNVFIKVKLGSKPKKKGKKKKLSLNKYIDVLSQTTNGKSSELENDSKVNDHREEMYELQNSDKAVQIDSKECRKRKRKLKESSPCSDVPLATLSSNISDDVRPKRNVKRPVKYNDDVAFSSSDEELHIFTPKKKKHSKDKSNVATEILIDLTEDELEQEVIKEDKTSTNEKIKKNINKEKKLAKETNTSKPVKLAPIFKSSQPDLAAIEAKQKFLQSGVPTQLKKLISKQKEHNDFVNIFSKVVHVQQLHIHNKFPSPPTLNLKKNKTGKIKLPESEDIFYKLLNLTSINAVSINFNNNISSQAILQNLKEVYPRFPIYRTYKLLKGKKKGEFKTNNNILCNLDNSVEILNCSIDTQNDNPDQLTWCDKYKPLLGTEIIGNFESVKELKKWLVTWTDNHTKSKTNNLKDSDSSDYYQSDPDSRDSMKSNNNLLILSGPVGSGKSSSVYAVAAELSIKVIEVNASSKRTGKIMLQDLQEATQSHKVNRVTVGSDNSQKSQEIVGTPPEMKLKKRGRPKKLPETAPKKLTKLKSEITNSQSSSQESTRMSLILIDDADIVFDQDDGFCSAIVQLVQSSKRPVILITGSLSCPHLQRFVQNSRILKMKPLLPNILGTWLDLMCLADSGTSWPGLGSRFLNHFQGDIRKTINCLQFYFCSQKQVLNNDDDIQTDLQNNDVLKLNADDENSCMSWADRDILDSKMNIDSHLVWESFLNKNMDIKYINNPLKIFNVWWNLPRLMKIETNLQEQGLNSENNKSLESISNVLDTISLCDSFSCMKQRTEANLTSNPWYDAESDSVSELETFDYYDRKFEMNDELKGELLKSSITAAKQNLELDNKFTLHSPGMSVKRQRDRIVSRHNDLTSYLSLQSSLDRRALALDYWSSCRSICRIEKSKTDINSKRNNRFCHYLKLLSFQCKNDSFDKLTYSLNPVRES